MSNFMRLEMVAGREDYFTVIIDVGCGEVHIADGLSRDEALGVIAAALFKDIPRIPFTRPLASRAAAHAEKQS